MIVSDEMSLGTLLNPVDCATGLLAARGRSYSEFKGVYDDEAGAAAADASRDPFSHAIRQLHVSVLVRAGLCVPLAVSSSLLTTKSCLSSRPRCPVARTNRTKSGAS